MIQTQRGHRSDSLERIGNEPVTSARSPPFADDGHQLRSPSFQTIAGTRIERTRNVSIEHAECDGEADLDQLPDREHGEHAERAGEDQPRARDHRPGGDERAQHPLARPVLLSLLAHTAHQEDVVVGAEGDEEDEDDQRELRIDDVLPEDVAEHEQRDAQRGEVGEDHSRQEEERRDERTQEHDQRQQDDEEHDRGDHLRVAHGRRPVVGLAGACLPRAGRAGRAGELRARRGRRAMRSTAGLPKGSSANAKTSVAARPSVERLWTSGDRGDAGARAQALLHGGDVGGRHRPVAALEEQPSSARATPAGKPVCSASYPRVPSVWFLNCCNQLLCSL